MRNRIFKYVLFMLGVFDIFYLFGGNTLKYVVLIKCCINTTKYDNYVVLINCKVDLGVFSHISQNLGIRHGIRTCEYFLIRFYMTSLSLC